MKRIILALIILTFAALSSGTAPTQAAGEPVVLVHGYGQTPTSMKPLADFLTARGYRVYNLSVGSTDNVANAKTICNFIQSNNLTGVTLVGHSMGGYSTLYCANFLDTGRRVRTWVSIDTHLNGVTKEWGVCLPFVASGQMCPGSAFLKKLWAAPLRSDVFYEALWLEPQYIAGICTRDIDGTYNLTRHQALPSDPQVQAWVLDAITRRAC